MRCPHCSQKFGLFDRELNKWGRDKVCPSCGKPIAVGVNLGRFFAVALPLLVVGVLVKNVVLRTDSSIALMISVGAAAVVGMPFSFELKSRDESKKTDNS